MTVLALQQARSHVRALTQLSKPRVVSLVVFCAVVGMLLSTSSLPDMWRVTAAIGGISLVAGAAAMVNCLVERAIDMRMCRTARRATVTGEIRPIEVGSVALLLGSVGMVILLAFVNALTAWLTLATFVGYAVIYTVWLKPLTPQNIVIGGASGAMPPLLGWTAVTDEVNAMALVLFLIIYTWTPPHFWALALYRREDYRRVGLPMLPVTHGERFTTRAIILYTLLLLGTTLLPLALGQSGWFYLICALLLNMRLILLAMRLHRNYDDGLSRKLFTWSIWYLTWLFVALLVDHYWLIPVS